MLIGETWTQAEIWAAEAGVCKHVISESLPKPGSPKYMGFEICPYCGRTAPMGTRFSEDGKDHAAEVRDS